MARQSELERLEEERAAWLDGYREPRDLRCPRCDAVLGTLFFITWAEQPLMDAVADGRLGGVPTQGFYVLVSQREGELVPLKGRRRYARGAPPADPAPPAWVGLPGEVTCAACGELAQIPHPRFPAQARLDALKEAAGRGPRRRWRH
ncbi:MAG TPA: hypothetical protein VFL91_30325 [Thermomicrobiales bacterium]|nr:hypothetical protein [Thermomicrobiales bacterium]